MAAVNQSQGGGFSYAQAAKGRASATTSQTPSSKVTSGTATPATSTLPELTSGGSWADAVEVSAGEKKAQAPAQQTRTDEGKSLSPPKDGVVESVKSEEKQNQGASGVSSPDLGASSSTTTTHDDSSSAPNASSSESTWENKSQTSEPSWIVERKERQTNSQPNEKPSKGEKKAKDAASPSPPPPVLHDAPPPTVNIWQKRAEDAKAKTTTASLKPAPAASTPQAPALKENQKPRADPRRKTNSVAGIPAEPVSSSGDDTKKTGSVQSKRANDVRATGSQQNSRTPTDDVRSDSPLAAAPKGLQSDRSSAPSLTVAPSSVKDTVAWPTPDTADKERKVVGEKSGSEKREDDSTPTGKREKQKWTVMPVVPSVRWETDVMNAPDKKKPRPPPNGDRPRGSGARRGGSFRGAANGVNGGDRHAASSSSSPLNQDSHGPTPQRSSDRDAMPPPSKPNRSSSAGPKHGQKQEKAHVAADAVTADSTDATKLSNKASKPASDARPAKSPKVTDDEPLPKQTPRRSSVGTQTEDAAESGEGNLRDTPAGKSMPSDAKPKEPRENGWNAPPRGGKRGGRGRGGNSTRELPNGHQPSHGYGNNYGADLATASPYGVPPSPSMYRGNHQMAYPPPGRGGWRGNSRSQSIPLENFYAQQRFMAPYGAPQMQAMQPYGPGMFDMNGYPMPAAPYPDSNQELMQMVGGQIEYYFSIDNLLKDMFLRKHMDSQGFVFLDVITNFNRIKSMTTEREIIRAVCINSEIVEIRVGDDGKERLRKREGWDQFLLPMDQREPSAQTNGPERIERPERPQIPLNNIPPQFRGPHSAGFTPMHQRFDRRSYDTGYPMMNGYAPQFAPYGAYPEHMYGEMMNGGDEMRGRSAKSPINDNVVSPTSQAPGAGVEGGDAEQDMFPDDQVGVLTVVVRTQEQQKKVAYHSEANRTFSNGSIDSRSIMSELEKSTETKTAPTPNGESLPNGTESGSNLSRQLSPSAAPSRDSATANPDFNVFWVKDQDYPVENLPNDLTQEPYTHLRDKALDQRSHGANGTCPYDMDILYQFWCHFLIRNFNFRMYQEFRHYANEDAKQRYSFTGLQNLVQFYSKSLSSHNAIRDAVVRDYVELVRNEPAKLEGVAFKQLRSAWRNGALNLKNRKKLAGVLDDKLKEQLDRLDS